MAQAVEPIVPDASLGEERSQLQRNVNVRGALGDRVTGGAVRGQNLFHSFERFNIEADQRVYFSNPVEIENILGRITGLEPSAINGLLGVDGSASLFLINPNGIVFGPNARLDVDGSFTAGTADQFDLGSGQVFSAREANAAPLVMVNIPVGLQFIGEQAPARLENAAQLAVGNDLMLVAGEVVSSGDVSATYGKIQLQSVSGDLQVQGLDAGAAELVAKRDLILNNSQLRTTQDLLLQAENVVQARDSAEAPFIADAGGKLTIQAEQAIDILALSHPQTQIQSGSDLRLSSDGVVSGDAHFTSGGDFSIATLAGQPGQFVSLYDPIIRSTGNVALGDYTGAALKIEAQGSIQGGNITITAPDTPNSIPASDPDFVRLTERPSLILRAGVPVTDPTASGTAPADSPANLIVGNIDTSVTPNSDFTRAGAVILSAPGSIAAGDIEASAFSNFISTPIEGGLVQITAGAALQVGNIDTSAASNASAIEGLRAGNVNLTAGSNLQFSTIDTTAFGDGIGEGGNVTVSAQGLVQGTGIIPDLASTIWTEGGQGNGRTGTIAITHDGGLGNAPFIVGDAAVNGVAGILDAGTTIVASTTRFPNPGTETRGPADAVQITFNNTAPNLNATGALASETNESVSFTLAELGVTTSDPDNDNVTLELAGNGQGRLSIGDIMVDVGQPIALTETLTYTPPQDFSGNTTAFTLRSSDGLETSEVAIAVSVEVPPVDPVDPPDITSLIEEGFGSQEETSSAEEENQTLEDIPFMDTQDSSVASLAAPECNVDERDGAQAGEQVLAIASRGGVPLPPTASFLLAAEAESLDWVELNIELPDLMDTEFSEKAANTSSLGTRSAQNLAACRAVLRLPAP